MGGQRLLQTTPTPGASTPPVLTSTDEYFPLSADAKVRELMGVVSPHRRGRSRDSTSTGARTLATPSPSLTITSSGPTSQAHVASMVSVRPAEVAVRKGSASHIANLARVPAETVIGPNAVGSHVLQHLPSTTFTPPMKAKMSPDMMPAALRVGTLKQSPGGTYPIDPPSPERRQTVPEQAYALPFPASPQAIEALADLADLAKQTESLFARHARLRSERQSLCTEITQGLRESKPGPDYVNTLLDQHMSLATITSSMDICFAKLKSLDCRKENAIAVLAAQAVVKTASPTIPGKVEKSNTLAPLKDTGSNAVRPASPPLPSPALTEGQVISMYQHMKRPEIKSIILPIMGTPAMSVPPMPLAILTTKDLNLEADQKALPRRMNIKGAKAAKILGIVEDETNERPVSPAMFSHANYNHTQTKSKPSLSRIDVDFANKPSNPAPERPLPMPPASSSASARKPSITFPPSERALHSAATKKSISNAFDPQGPSTSSSRASSPDDRELQTPLEEEPTFNDQKSPSIQTVHVYMGEGVMRGRMSNMDASIIDHRLSHIGEDDLLDYYRDLQ